MPGSGVTVIAISHREPLAGTPSRPNLRLRSLVNPTFAVA